ncbi:MAG: bifunctional DNA-formamidopyrimidine glycosylase/DNA-(apurinic or apyrimidinic site) lyase [Phycisphaerae bacterium]|nr:bifunctional DNA-formamidopyrimidine glycosylase/DNA-(apurinic or apyrimidinic site) lyase [Phycisphaerae bacterium]
MPELPEVEHLRRSLVPFVEGARVIRAQLHRSDILDRSAVSSRLSARDALLFNRHITSIQRHGKQLALMANDGAVLCVHLGMSGQLTLTEADCLVTQQNHQHAEWLLQLSDGSRAKLIFRDPRRFGGLWHLPSRAALDERWAKLGPDALAITAAALAGAVERARRPIKSVLLDQSLVAGVGNIYADEALFRSRIAPTRLATLLNQSEVHSLAKAVRQILTEAVNCGGSTVNDYVDARGKPGSFQRSHKVYGRAGLECDRCPAMLVSSRLAGRTTVWCPDCQPTGLMHSRTKL